MERLDSKLLQERRTTDSATPPPTAHQSFSRLTWNHRVRLGCRTGEASQEPRITGYAFSPVKSETDLSIARLRLRFHSPFGAILGRRFPSQLLEDPIELREGLEPRSERDFAYAQIGFAQELRRFLEADPRDILHEVRASSFLEFFAQIVCARVRGLRHLRQRKLFPEMFVDKIARLPDPYRFDAVTLFSLRLFLHLFS